MEESNKDRKKIAMVKFWRCQN